MAAIAVKKKNEGPIANLDNYILEITLCPNTLPKKHKIIRTLSVPASTNFNNLHNGIYIAFQRWDDSRPFDFKIHNYSEWTKKTENESGIDGPLLKVLGEPLEPTFAPWWRPKMRPTKVTPEVKAKDVSLGSLLEDRRYKGKGLQYTWDDLSHIIIVKKRVAGTKRMELISGKWNPALASLPEPFTDADKDEVITELSLREEYEDQVPTSTMHSILDPPPRDSDEYSDEEYSSDDTPYHHSGWREADALPSTVKVTKSSNSKSAASIMKEVVSEEIEGRATKRVSDLVENMRKAFKEDFESDLSEAERDGIITKVFQRQIEVLQTKANQNGLKRGSCEAEGQRSRGSKRPRHVLGD